MPQIAPGYDYDPNPDHIIDPTTLQYVSANDHLTCPICQLAFTNPYTTTCGHTFCYACLDESLRMTGMKCPLDRTALCLTDLTQVYPSPVIIKNLLDELKVKCLNDPRGCPWQGPRWEIKTHLDGECSYTRFPCNGDDDEPGCGELTERRFLDELNNNCPHMPVTCECGQQLLRIQHKDHLEHHCRLNIVTCTGCNLPFTKAELGSHELYCERKYMKCELAAIGCDWKGTRLLFETVHARTCPMLKMAEFLNQQRDKIQLLEDQNRSLERKVTMILDSVVQGQVKNLGHGLFYDEVRAGSDGSAHSLARNGVQSSEMLLSSIEMDNVRSEVSKLQASMLNSTHTLVQNIMAENWRMKDELNLQKVSINSLRQQMRFLLMEHRRSSNVYSSSYSSDDENGSSSSVNGIKL